MKALKVIRKNITVSNINLSFFIGCLIVLASHSLFLTGLNEDGSFDLSRLVLLNDNPFFEIQRHLFNSLHKLPIWIFITFTQSTNIVLLATIYSFSLVYVHILVFISVYFILPKNRKQLIFFPLFAFLTGPMTILDISVSVSLSVCSYLWLAIFTIYYSDFSKKIHKFIFCIVPLPLFLSHEMMIYMVGPLIALCLLKIKKEQQLINQFLIKVMLVFFIVIFFFYYWFLLNIQPESNFLSFKSSLLHLNFLYSNSAINLLIVQAIVLKFSLIVDYYFQNKKQLQQILLCFFILSFLITVFLPLSIYSNFFYIESYLSRSWVPVISLPLSLLLWWNYEKKSFNFKNSKIFLLSCLIFLITSTVYRVKFDLNFYNHQKQFSKKLENCKGILEWSAIKNHFYDINNYKFLEEQVWKITSISLMFPKKNQVNSLIINNTCKSRLNSKFNLCKKLSFNIPHSLFESDLNDRFFDFRSLMKNTLNTQSYCNK